MVLRWPTPAAPSGAACSTRCSGGARPVQKTERGRINAPGGALRRRVTAQGEQVPTDGERRLREVRRRSFAGLCAAQIDQLTHLLDIVLATPFEQSSAPKPRTRRAG
jgi:hypothetical protein